jgi:hypothetical protein
MPDISTVSRFTKVLDGGDGRYEVLDVKDPAKIYAVAKFQEGPASGGVNGVWAEDLLDICVARLRSYQAGPLPHPTNDEAIFHILAAKGALAKRTADRIGRKVEGSMEE